MNIITDGLPDCIEIGGEIFHINTDFRVWVKIELLFSDDVPEGYRLPLALGLAFDVIPENKEEAAEALLAFYSGGKNTEKKPSGKKKKSRKNRRIYSFEYDSEYIYAAFLQAYGIDLADVKMHWFKFKALFAALPDECLMSKIMGWRALEITKDMPEASRKRYAELKETYRLPLSQTEEEKIRAAKEFLMGGG